LLLAPFMLAQVGPGIGYGEEPASQLPIEIIEKKDEEARKRAMQAMPSAPARPVGCMAAAEASPERTVTAARNALNEAVGRERVRAGFCLGVALSDLERWPEAQQAFANARDAADAEDHESRARLGAMAGNAALAQGDAAQALLLLDPAAGEARTADDKPLIASIGIDRARALVATKRTDEAAAALTEAREAEPDNAQAWLLSATLSRRQNKLVEAQAQIQEAARLSPRDPEIGLEAGVIAALSGNDAAARRSFDSVVSLAPGTEMATKAQAYLGQLGPQGGKTP
jgi:tetratricopeptide (TPR) repeat protein